MLAGIVYSFLIGVFYIIGVIAAFKDNSYYSQFLYWAWRVIVLNLVLAVLNIASWILLLVRQGQNDYGANANWICEGFSALNWDFCGYVTGQFVFFVIFTILSVIAYHLAKAAFDGLAYDGVRRNPNENSRRGNESEESLLIHEK